jgi:hypothetical protein
MCEECGIHFGEPEYMVYDLYNYTARPQRCYRREDHFKEVLAQFQGNDGKELPVETLEQIRADLRDKQGVTEIKRVLRKLKLTKYVENAYSSTFALTGQQPPYIKREIQDKIIRMFKQIVRVWDSISTDDRQSFLSYYYVIYKLLDLMGQEELLPQACLLRTPLRIKSHDKIWVQICDELGWTFEATLPPKAPKAAKSMPTRKPKPQTTDHP